MLGAATLGLSDFSVSPNLTFSYVTLSQTTTIPVTAQAGDFAIYIQFQRWLSGGGYSAITFTTPTGWSKKSTGSTAINTTGTTNDYYGAQICYKVLAPGDNGAVLTNLTSNYQNSHQIFVYRPNKAIATVGTTYGSALATNNTGIFSIPMDGLSGNWISIFAQTSQFGATVTQSNTTPTRTQNTTPLMTTRVWEHSRGDANILDNTINITTGGYNQVYLAARFDLS